MNLSTPTLTDFQPYLLPGTDPWSLPEEKAVSLLHHLNDRGYKQVYCIPPIKQESRFKAADAIEDIFLSFQQRFPGDWELKLAARYRLDDGFMALLHEGTLLSIGKHLIVDVSPLSPYEETFNLLKAITRAGHTPILVQPERTTYWKEENFIRLREKGARLMLNLYSLFGYNGDDALMYSRRMLSEGMYDYVCSGMEDTKIMRYSEQFVLNETDTAIKELKRLEENGRALWQANENGK